LQTGANHTILSTISNISGIRGMYAGFLVTIMREIPFALIQFPLYEHMKVCFYFHDFIDIL
jgi:solute carrier family 25 S-adenosylmethionine transporter 26